MHARPPSSAPALATLTPACFAIVMATGIVSLAARAQGWQAIATVLFAVNIAAWLACAVLTALRGLRFPGEFYADLSDHLRGPGFFTAVAGTAVLGSQFAQFGVGGGIAAVLDALAAALWVVLTYAIFTLLTIKEQKPPLERGISGAWLLAVVATQSLAVLSSLIAARTAQPWKLELNFFAFSMWLWGGMLYIWMISLIFYRYTFLRFAPGDLTPPYWINMGAMAISTLAGSLLIANAPDAPFLLAVLPFLKGFTILYWATGTWWIPMLLVLGAWRYFVKRFPVRYDPLYWGAVFPLGMYSIATHEMSSVLQLPFLGFVPIVFLAAALAAWTAVFVGLARHLLRLTRT